MSDWSEQVTYWYGAGHSGTMIHGDVVEPEDKRVTPAEPNAEIEPLSLAGVKPYFSICILEHLGEDARRGFNSLCIFLRRQMADSGRALSVKFTGEIRIDDADQEIRDIGILASYGFDELYGATRLAVQKPSWAANDSTFVDRVNQLTVALRRRQLVAIRSDRVSSAALRKWVNQPTTTFRMIPPDVLAGTFSGDGTMLWLKGIHRRRASKADTKAYSGSRLQEAVDALDDASYLMSAMSVKLVPEEADALLRGRFTVSPEKSQISFKSMADFATFLTASDEALGLIEKALTDDTPPEALYPVLAVREKDLRNVYGAYDITIATPEEILLLPHPDEATLDRAELLRGSLLEVTGTPDSQLASVLSVVRQAQK